MTASGPEPPDREVSVSSNGHPRSSDGPRAVDAKSTIAQTIGVMAVAATAAGLFLPHQTLWIDETTQLSGLRLSPLELVRWLAHPALHDFGVPGDRMPPLSYWLGWIWSRFFGLNERSLRCLGLVCVAAAAGLVSSAGRRAFGLRAGLFAGLFLALSPNVCATAVEIRAYPLFLLTTAGALRALVVLLRSPGPAAGRRIWIELAVWLVLGIYTHFFGALFAGVVVFWLGVDRMSKRYPLRPAAALAAPVGLAVVGLVPFVIASVGLSAATVRNRPREVVQLVYRLVGHPTLTVFPLVTLLVFGAAAVLALAAWRLPRAPRDIFRFVALVLITGIAISAAADFVVGGFTAAKVSYSTWALPLLSFALAAPLAQPPAAPSAQLSRRWSRIGLVAASVFLAAEGTGIAQLARHGDYFAHGPQTKLQEILDGFAGQPTAVVYADPVGEYAAAYFPLRFANGPSLPQFVFTEPGVSQPLGIPLDPLPAKWGEQLRGYSHLVVVRSKAETASQIAEQIRHGDRPFEDSRLTAALEASGRWRPHDHRLFVAFVSADVLVLDRTAPEAR